MVGIYSIIEVAHGAYLHHILPMVVLFENLEELILTYHLRQYAWIFQRRYAEQHAIIVFVKTVEVYLLGICEQRTIVEIIISIYIIIGGI